MSKKTVLWAALALLVGAAIFFAAQQRDGQWGTARRGFIEAHGTCLMLDGHPFRFVGANVAVMYREEDRARMPETLRQAARDGIRVVRVWASGEGTEETGVKSIGADREDWPRKHPFRRAPDDWNEEAFVHLDRVLAEAARHNLRVQLCLTNWWRDTGGVTQYLRWAGILDAADEHYPYGVNPERAMLFYTNEETRRLYREHVEKIVLRRNTITDTLYRDDPTIMSYELMNEAQAPTGRWAERHAWVAEMSAYVKSLDPHHLVTPGAWGYRNALERRAWLELHHLPNIDYCDVHNYPRDDLDTYVDSPDALREFIENRAAAAFSINKPLVIGEFGMSPDGYKGLSEAEWFRAYFDSAARAGVSGAMFWIITPDPKRGYGVTYTVPRDEKVHAEIAHAAQLFTSLQNGRPPSRLLNAGQHLVPRQFAFARASNDSSVQPTLKVLDNGALLYGFAPEQAIQGRFEKTGGGAGYVWGAGVGFVEYIVPARDEWRRVSEIVVRAHIKPVLPHDAHQRIDAARVTLFINGTDCGSRLVPAEIPPHAVIQEWRVKSLLVRAKAARGLPLLIRFAVEVDADQPYGLDISNFPEGYDPHGASPVEVEVR